MNPPQPSFEERARQAGANKLVSLYPKKGWNGLDAMSFFEAGAIWGRAEAWGEVIALLKDEPDNHDGSPAAFADWLNERKPKP